jgi:hypothetical protein
LTRQEVDARCGECGRALKPAVKDLSVRHFLREGLLAITDFDSTLLASFRSLLTKPGELTAEYLHGDRSRFLPPLRIFLLCNLIYFIAAASYQINVLTIPLRVQTEQMTYKNGARALLRRHLDEPEIISSIAGRRAEDRADAAFAVKYDAATETVGKAIVIVLIPLFALVLQGLYAGSGRYFVEHLVLATHLSAFLLLAIPALSMAAIGVLYLLYYALHVRSGFGETQVDTVLLSVVGAYAFRAQRAAYGTARMVTVLRTSVLMVMLVPTIVVLKFVLFLVTLYWVS